MKSWVLGAVLVALAGPAHGQSRRYPSEPVDMDRASEQHSELWEDALHPNRDRYRARVERAKEFMHRRDARSWDEAEDLLRSAIALDPDEPLGHWLAAVLYERREKWRQCTASYDRVAALEPGYQPAAGVEVPSGRKPDWALDAGLASCHAHDGAFEQAIFHYKHALGRGVTEAPLYVGLGEAYMALGRLAEATDALTMAAKLQPGNRHTSYALAMAYDRDEREAESRAALATALRYDPNLAWLRGQAGRFVPAADEFYYLGMAHAARSEPEWAMLYFRQYLHVSGAGPWQRRVQHHLDDLARAPMLGPDSISMRGTDTLDKRAAAASLAPVATDLLNCMKPVPGLLLQVTITAVGTPERSNRGSRTRRVAILGVSKSEAPGVKARILHSFATEPDSAARAQACVEAVAERVSLPRPRGGAHRYVSISVPLIAPAPDPGRLSGP